jgi:hypothetical protein
MILTDIPFDLAHSKLLERVAALSPAGRSEFDRRRKLLRHQEESQLDADHAAWIAWGGEDLLENLTREFSEKRTLERAAATAAEDAIYLKCRMVVNSPASSDEDVERAEAERDNALAAWKKAYAHLWPKSAMNRVKGRVDIGVTAAAPVLPLPSNWTNTVELAPSKPASVIRSAATLQTKHFEPVRYIVPGLIVEGLTIQAGYPKIGKSWMVLDVGLAVAGGGSVLGAKVEQPGDVLYLALEDNERRLKSRIQKILGPFAQWPSRFQYATAWPRAEEGGLDQIRAWIDSVADPRLVIIDVLAKFRSPQSRSVSAYDADYKAIQELQSIASARGIGIIVVHHLRKSAGEGDPFDKVSGTLGLSGGADTIAIIDRDAGAGTVLYTRGRDIEEFEKAIEFDKQTCRWRVLGNATEVRRSDSRNAILGAIKEGGPMNPSDLAIATGLKPDNIRQLLFKMVRTGEVYRTVGGAYDTPPTHPRNSDNNGNAFTPPPLPTLPT